jgi:beta-galactosidase
MRLGVCYYPEHWPETKWADDARQMRELGIRQVRIGEFCWSRIEPKPGEFDWGWLDRAVAVLANAGLKIVMCTPTATPPKWLVDADPDMLAVGADGRRRAFGSRRHYDFSSDTYLHQAQRITRAFATRYGLHPSVIAWQTDNEYGCHDTVLSYSPQAVKRFRKWLARRYASIAKLNESWGTVFWSQEYTSFDQIDAPIATVTEAHPAHVLSYRRFASDEVVRFNRAQCEIFRELSPGRALTHNFMQCFTAFDHYAVAADLDVASWDSYPLGALEMFWFSEAEKLRWHDTGHPDLGAFHHDLYRGMSKQPFWVMEQQPGPVNWAHWNPAPAPGMVRLWTWEAFAHGADVVSYFRWRQAPYAQEQMHTGLQLPEGSPDIGGIEAATVARELKNVPLQQPTRAAVALVFDYTSVWIIGTQPQGKGYDGFRACFEAYGVLRSLGIDVDIVPTGADLNDYSLVILPASLHVGEELVASLKATSASVICYPRTGSKTSELSIPHSLPPGTLQALIDIRVARVESLRPGANTRLVFDGEPHLGSDWCETVECGKDVVVDATFSDGKPAIMHQDRVYYLAGGFSRELLRTLFARLAAKHGLSTIELPDGLRVRRRGNLRFVFNYNATVAAIHLPNMRWLIGDCNVGAHGVSIAEQI